MLLMQSSTIYGIMQWHAANIHVNQFKTHSTQQIHNYTDSKESELQCIYKILHKMSFYILYQY